ncbi:hypothetical protein [Vibrio neptunius]|uniref:hypothetical protein n=1 Tax=Vibrio neptunius TaxID=170651 RepID=UPI001C5C8826|nr:hypothetical protein [Vibrio neptunius]QXX05649.1 hypothetical protein KW548_10545 [Vibrio neptunius]
MYIKIDKQGSTLTSWILQDFNIGDISCQIIEFTVEHHDYVMVFNLVNATRTKDMINEKADELGIEYREHSYEVKFDLKVNFESDNFFDKPDIALSVTAMRELGYIIKELLDFHYRNSHAEAYLYVAESDKLKRFYDRLAKLYSEELHFVVTNNLGEEALGYEITTPSYKSERGESRSDEENQSGL